jgi:phosphoglycerate dehydrogenase-like enzyme
MKSLDMKKIAVLDDYQTVALESADWTPLNGRAELTVYNDDVDDDECLIDRLVPFDAICVMRERSPLPRKILERLPNLRFISSTGARNASIDLPAARDLGIVVSATGANGSGPPELTWALILAAARHIPKEVTSFQKGGWQTTVGQDLSGSTLGVIGLGKIGRQIPKVGQAFGMDVIAWSQNLTDDAAQAAGVRRVERRRCFARPTGNAASRSIRVNDRYHRPRGTGDDEAYRLVGEHSARASRRRNRVDRCR